MKSVLMSIQPEWCYCIANGKKTVEVRKNKPKLETPFKVYIYCTKPKNKFDYGLCIDKGISGNLKNVGLLAKCNYETAQRMDMTILSGKVIGEFVCDCIEEIAFSPIMHGKYICKDDSFVEQSCLIFEELFDYLGERCGYGWHISNLVIYDEPKNITDFVSASTLNTNCFGQRLKRLDRAPQSWCYAGRAEK